MRHRWMVTGALAGGLGACGGAREPAAAAAPAPVPPPFAPVSAAGRSTSVCVVQDGELRRVPAQYDARTGDTLVNGRPLAAVRRDTVGYAAAAEWYVRGEHLAVDRRRYVKYGLPREILPELLTRAGEYRGVRLFAARETVSQATEHGQTSDIRYVPVRPGCVFQPYEHHANVGAVRG